MTKDEQKDLILSGLAAGRTLVSICRERGMPSVAVVNAWCEKDEEFDLAYKKARQIGYDVRAEEVLEIVDQEPERVVGKEGSKIDAGYVAWQRLRADMRLKNLERVCPERYAVGTKVSIGNTDDKPLKVEGVDTAALTLQLAAALRGAKGESDA